MRGPFVKVGKLEEDTVFSWPNLLIAELVVLLITIIGVMVVSIFFNAPLEHPVNVMHPPNPAKAPWYFLGLQEQVSYSAFWGGVGVPAIELLLLILVPYIDRGKAGVGRWFARERVLANIIFLTFVLINVVLIVIGTFFRGANWRSCHRSEELKGMRLALAVVSLVVLIVLEWWFTTSSRTWQDTRRRISIRRCAHGEDARGARRT